MVICVVNIGVLIEQELAHKVEPAFSTQVERVGS